MPQVKWFSNIWGAYVNEGRTKGKEIDENDSSLKEKVPVVHNNSFTVIRTPLTTH